MRTLVILLLTTTLAQAAPVTVTLSDDEQRAFLQILDAAAGGGKTGGLEMAKGVVYFWNKLHEAAQPQITPPPRPPKEPEK